MKIFKTRKISSINIFTITVSTLFCLYLLHIGLEFTDTAFHMWLIGAIGKNLTPFTDISLQGIPGFYFFIKYGFLYGLNLITYYYIWFLGFFIVFLLCIKLLLEKLDSQTETLKNIYVSLFCILLIYCVTYCIKIPSYRFFPIVLFITSVYFYYSYLRSLYTSYKYLSYFLIGLFIIFKTMLFVFPLFILAYEYFYELKGKSKSSIFLLLLKSSTILYLPAIILLLDIALSGYFKLFILDYLEPYNETTFRIAVLKNHIFLVLCGLIICSILFYIVLQIKTFLNVIFQKAKPLIKFFLYFFFFISFITFFKLLNNTYYLLTTFFSCTLFVLIIYFVVKNYGIKHKYFALIILIYISFSIFCVGSMGPIANLNLFYWIPVTIVLILSLKHTNSTYFKYLLFIFISSYFIYYTINNVRNYGITYLDSTASLNPFKNREIKVDRLKGIYTSPERASAIEDTYQFAIQHIKKNDHVFIYRESALLYFILDKTPPVAFVIQFCNTPILPKAGLYSEKFMAKQTQRLLNDLPQWILLDKINFIDHLWGKTFEIDDEDKKCYSIDRDKILQNYYLVGQSKLVDFYKRK